MKMDKVGILTYHNTTRNCGAALQSYATVAYFSERFPEFDFEIIDYRCPAIEKKYSTWGMLQSSKISCHQKLKRLLALPFSYIQKLRFRKFIGCFSHSPKYDTRSVHKTDERYGHLIIGSDQLWNFRLNGNDSVYLMPFIKDKTKIMTYATSIATSQVPPEMADVFTQCVSSYRAVSLREKDAQELVCGLTNRRSRLVVDPVFLVDRHFWLDLVDKKSVREQYVTFYLFHSSSVGTSKKIMGQLGIGDYRIHKLWGGISIKDMVDSDVKVCLTYGPREVLRDICGSNFVFTDSFHCTAMAIIFHVPFIVFLGGDPGADSRLLQLLEMTGLQDRIYSGGQAIPGDIDWEKVDQVLEKNREDSRDYISSSFH